MGQKVNPIGLRVGYIRGWDSSWFSGKQQFSEKLMEDNEIRKYILTRMSNASISKIIIERTLKTITLSIHTARPGIIIGKGGAEVDNMREELKRIRKKDIQINILEVRTPELDAKLLAQSIATQLKSRSSHRRAMKKAIESATRAGAKGIKIRLSGRLGGAEMARVEEYRENRIPLSTLRAEIDYAVVGAHTIYGTIGVKVWIFKKEIYEKPGLSPSTFPTPTSAKPNNDSYNKKFSKRPKSKK